MANHFVYQDKYFTVGSIIAVTQKIKEGGKERQQVFEGRLIKVKNGPATKSFTVRKIAAGQIGVERIWAVGSPLIVKIQMKKPGQVKKAKLYHLRDRIGKQAVILKTRTPKKIKL